MRTEFVVFDYFLFQISISTPEDAFLMEEHMREATIFYPDNCLEVTKENHELYEVG
jgi:hypothetical protein